MATSRLNSEEFVNLVNGLKGVILVYKSTDRDGNEKETAQQFFGADYEPKDKTQDEIFRVWKNVVMTFWAVKAEEIKLREANDGIRSKLRATTPCAVIFRTEKGETVKRFELEESVWAKIGLVPTKKDFERTARDYKKAIHAAAKASFDALGFRVALPREAEQPVPQPAEVPGSSDRRNDCRNRGGTGGRQKQGQRQKRRQKQSNRTTGCRTVPRTAC
ncbi:hypothetical protein NXV14_22765 [Bacteroides fragilis]|nr:hypothetical protein [Bacteroides fragilis]